MNEEYQISIIVPVYNCEKHIKQCVDSILAQTYENIEVILVDGDSQDDTPGICDDYSEKDSRVIVIHKENRGVTNDRKAGLEIARGEYIAFVDGDDWIDLDMYSYLLKLAINNKADIVTSGAIIENELGSRTLYDGLNEGLYKCDAEGRLQSDALYIGSSDEHGLYIALWNKLFRREVIVDNILRMDDRITHYEDIGAYICAMLDSEYLYITNKAFYHYRVSNGSSTYKRDSIFYERLNSWYMYMFDKMLTIPHSHKLESDIGKLMIFGLFEGLDYHFDYIGDERPPRYVFPINEVKEERILLYGAGNVGQSFYRQIINNRNHEVVGWVDKKAYEYNEAIQPVEKINQIIYDIILVAVKSEKMYSEIRDELEEKGIACNNIRWFKPIYVMDYIFGNYDVNGNA